MNIDIDFKISESATGEFKKIISESATKEDVVRVSVQNGCSGVSYGLGFVAPSEISPSSDIVGEYDGVKVVVDRTSLLTLDGITLEWVDTPDQKGFKFSSAKACKKQCGCSRNR
ncbi:iron-sulfur cluster assembly accessory protein [bacterium]|nr:iron-sulfur cluster assembly accessory protein [bacterium]